MLYLVITRLGKCPSINFCYVTLPQADSAKYLGLHLDRTLTWRTHILNKMKQPN